MWAISVPSPWVRPGSQKGFQSWGRIGTAAEARQRARDLLGSDTTPPILTVICGASYSVLVVTPLSPPPEAEDKLRDIRSITDAALSYLDADEFLTELLSRVKETLDADTAAVLLLDRSARQLVATAASGLEEEVRQGVRLPVGQGFAGRIAAEARPITLDHVDHGNVLNPILLEKGIRSLIGVPLLVNGAVIGVLHVGSIGSRVFTGDDTALLQMAADRAALAVQSLRSRDDRAAATALQQSLLPPELPAVPGVEIAARYVPGDGRVGGDWYDVFTLPSGELCVVMGDVAGSGLEAAVIMGRMRSALRAYALETRDPAEVLSRLDRKIQHFEPAAMATVSYAVLEPATGHMHISAAGHFPPVAAAPDGAPTWPTSRSASRSASPMTHVGRPPPCLWRPARCCASSPTGWSSAGTRRSMTGSPASARSSCQSRRKGSVSR